MTFPGPNFEEKQQKHKMLIKQALLAPIWTRICVPCIVFCGESDGDIPGAKFWAKTNKIEETHIWLNNKEHITKCSENNKNFLLKRTKEG